MGRGWYPPAFSMDYRVKGEDGKVAKLYLSILDDEDEASRMVERFLAGLDGVNRLEGYRDLEAYSAEDRYRGLLFVARYGKWMLLCSGFPAGGKAMVQDAGNFLSMLP